MGGGRGAGGLIVVSRQKHLLNRPGKSTVFFSLPARITTNKTQPSSPMMCGTRALCRNGRPTAIGGGRGPDGLIVVSRRKPLKSPWQKYCIFFPPSSNHNKPRAAVVTHDGRTRALRRNGHIQPWVAVEALADNAHGVSMMVKIGFVKKRDNKRSDVELWQESAYDSDGI